MFFLKRPEPEFIHAFLAGQENCLFSYSQGASRGEAPKGYMVDHNRIRLGNGAECFEGAVRAVRRWKMFEMPWVALCRPDTPITTGTSVAVLVTHIGVWSLNAARIVYVIEEHGTRERFGFAYGTLKEHAERVRSGLVLSFTLRTERCGTTFMRFPGRICWRGCGIRWRGRCKRGLRGSRRVQCKERSALPKN